jgi:hypothetical protein
MHGAVARAVLSASRPELARPVGGVPTLHPAGMVGLAHVGLAFGPAALLALVSAGPPARPRASCGLPSRR